MNGRIFFQVIIILITLLTFSALTINAAAQVQQTQAQNPAQTTVQKPIQNQPQKPVQKPGEKATQPQAPVVEELVFKKKIAEPSGGLITGLSGGYLSALGDMGTILKPSWYVKAFVYNNAVGGKALGVGFEAGYSKLKDVDNSGSITYIPTILYVTLTWDIFGIIEMQPKFGAGLTTMLAKIDNGITIKNNSSLDFTLSGGFAILKTFLKHYFVGADYQYYYFFERKSSKAHAINFFAGYKF